MNQGLIRKEYRNEIARHMANRLDSSILICDKVSEECTQFIDDKGMTEAMLKALEFFVERFVTVDYYQSLIARIICWFDLYAKSHWLILRRKYLEIISKTLEWSFQTIEEDAVRRRADFAPTDRKWIPYDDASQKVLNQAFFSGAAGCKCLVKRGNRPTKRVDIDFNSMKQADGTARENVKADLPVSVDVKLTDLMQSEATWTWPQEHNDLLMRLAVDVMQAGALDPKCSHSVLSFLSRQTKFPWNAQKFMDLQGMQAILRLKARCAPSYPFLVSVIIRNCIDDDNLIGQFYEKTIRQLIVTPSPPPLSASEYTLSKNKDVADTLNILNPPSTRNQLVFTETFNKLGRLQGSEVLPISKKAASAHGFIDRELPVGGAPGTTEAGAASSSSSSGSVFINQRAVDVVRMIISEVFNGDFTTNGQDRMLSQDKILKILAEIIKSYPSLSIIVAELKHEGTRRRLLPTEPI